MMDNLPKGWTSVPLKDIATVFLGKTPARSEYCSKGKYKVIKFRDLKSGHVDFSNAKDGYVIDKTKLVSSLKPLHKKDVLITSAAHSGENIGKKCAYIKRIPDQFKGVFFTGELLNIRAEYDETLAKWSYLYFLSAKGFKEIQSAVKGVHLTSGRANMMQIDIAPLNEQRRIVAKLEKLLQKVDACKERLDKIPTILKRFRQSVLAAACSGRLTADWREKNSDVEPATEPFNKNRREEKNTKNELPALNVSNLPELPHTWKWHRIANLFKVVTGTTPPKKDKDNFSTDMSDCPFFKPTDLDAGYLTEVSREYISKKGEKYCRILPSETVAVTSIGATIGKTGRLMIRSTTNQQINSILPTKNIIASYTFFYCNSEYFQKRIIEASSSTTLPIINKTRFGLLEYPLPSFAEQQEIVHRVEGFFKIADQIEERYKKARAYVDKLTQAILAKAFRGELVPQDLNDEPASELLKRIQEEKDRQTKKREEKVKK